MTVDPNDPLIEKIAEAIYALYPHYEGGEYVEDLQVTPGEVLSWEQAKARDVRSADDPRIGLITRFAYKTARTALEIADGATLGHFAPGEALEYWKEAIGEGAYKPFALGKHRAVHQLTVRRVLDSVRGTEAADVIAALVFWNGLHSDQCEQMGKSLLEAQEETSAILAREREAIIDIIAERCRQDTTPSMLIAMIRARENPEC